MSVTIIRHARVVTADGPSTGDARAQLQIVEDGAVALDGDRVIAVDRSDAMSTTGAEQVIDANGGVLLPGLVDPHTHLIFAGRRAAEFAAKMRGEDYRAIAARGGGIAATVRATRAATEESLFDAALRRARVMRSHGVTTIEVKSGYGLSLSDELRILRVAKKISKTGEIRVSATLLGAHAIPSERAGDRAGYLEEVRAMIAEAASQKLADACDVYLDAHAFSREESEAVLRAAKDAGLRIRAHVGQFSDIQGAELLADLGGLSCDHLEHVSDAGLDAMARANVAAVLLPGAWRTLRQTPPDAKRIKARGVRIAIGTDCNPGTSPCTDLLLCAALAVRDAGADPDDALLGITAHAARALGEPTRGRITRGGPADLALFEADDPHALLYALGDVRARAVWVAGRVYLPEEGALW